MNKPCLSLLLLFSLLFWSCESSQEKEEETTDKIETSMEEQFVFVGTYTRKEGHVDGKAKGIYVLKFEESTGSLSLLDTVESLPNPSYVTIHPNGKYLYAANELADGSADVVGRVSSYSIDPVNRSYQALSNVSAVGDAPCHLVVLPNQEAVVVANYVDGNVALLPLNNEGGLEEAAATAKHEGTGPNEGRQAGPHAHMVYPFPGQKDAFLAVDLGIDQVIHYQWNTEKQELNELARTAITPGAGPRHLDFHPTANHLYVLNELNHTVEVFEYKNVGAAFERKQIISTLSEDSQGVSYPAAIKAHPNGKFLYASNRGSTEEENSIAVFRIDEQSGELSFQKVVHTGGNFPRDFEISPSGNYVLAANQNSGNIVVFKVDLETGDLLETGTNFALPTPVSLKFLSI